MSDSFQCSHKFNTWGLVVQVWGVRRGFNRGFYKVKQQPAIMSLRCLRWRLTDHCLISWAALLPNRSNAKCVIFIDRPMSKEVYMQLKISFIISFHCPYILFNGKCSMNVLSLAWEIQSNTFTWFIVQCFLFLQGTEWKQPHTHQQKRLFWTQVPQGSVSFIFE